MGGISGIKCHQPLGGLSSAGGMSCSPGLRLSLNRRGMFCLSTACRVGAGLSGLPENRTHVPGRGARRWDSRSPWGSMTFGGGPSTSRSAPRGTWSWPSAPLDLDWSRGPARPVPCPHPVPALLGEVLGSECPQPEPRAPTPPPCRWHPHPQDQAPRPPAFAPRLCSALGSGSQQARSDLCSPQVAVCTGGPWPRVREPRALRQLIGLMLSLCKGQSPRKDRPVSTTQAEPQAEPSQREARVAQGTGPLHQ